MAKDDFHVIAYKILAYLYKCVKTGEKPSRDVLNAEFFEIPATYFFYVLRMLHKDGYIDGGFIEFQGQFMGIDKTHMEITPAGIEYMEENSAMQKAYKFLKEIKDWAALFIGG